MIAWYRSRDATIRKMFFTLIRASNHDTPAPRHPARWAVRRSTWTADLFDRHSWSCTSHQLLRRFQGTCQDNRGQIMENPLVGKVVAHLTRYGNMDYLR